MCSGSNPGNCTPDGRDVMRRQGRLKILRPGETVTYRVEVSMLDGEQWQEMKGERKNGIVSLKEILEEAGSAAAPWALYLQFGNASSPCCRRPNRYRVPVILQPCGVA